MESSAPLPRFDVITPDDYTRKLLKSEKLASERIKVYLKEPTEENVHDLRTSIRRLLTMANILPKKIRSRKDSKKVLERYEKLLKLNTEVRDMDIILSKLPRHGDDPAFSKLAKRLAKARESSLKQARQFASSIKDAKEGEFEPGDLSEKLVQKRFSKTAATLSKRIKKHLKIVVTEPDNSNELHKLREDSRRLRFTLELDDTPETSKLAPVLETWQNVLGKIRDSDIFVSRLKRERQDSNLSKILDNERSERTENYERFLEIAKESPKFSLK